MLPLIGLIQVIAGAFTAAACLRILVTPACKLGNPKIKETELKVVRFYSMGAAALVGGLIVGTSGFLSGEPWAIFAGIAIPVLLWAYLLCVRLPEFIKGWVESCDKKSVELSDRLATTSVSGVMDYISSAIDNSKQFARSKGLIPAEGKQEEVETQGE